MAGGGVGGLVRQLFGSRLLRNHHPPPPPPNAAQAHEVKAQQLFLPSFPVVLCPGLIFLRNQRYWGRIPNHMRERGLSCLEASVLGTGHVRERAAQLRHQIDTFLAAAQQHTFPVQGSSGGGGIMQTPARRRVNLIAFSMGGLDARWMIHHLGGHKVVESLTTISTPHLGSSLAKWFLGMGHHQRLRRLGLNSDALLCLTPEFAQHFNETTPNHPQVHYYSYAGLKQREAISSWAAWAYDHVYHNEGPNDGFVAEESARWGQFMGTVPASHLELIGWPLGVRPQHRYSRVTHFYDQVLHLLALEGH